MLLKDLIEDTPIIRRNVKDYNLKKNDVDYAAMMNDPNQGLYSKVKPLSGVPNAVQKTSRDPIQNIDQNDGYFYFASELAKNPEAKQNKYFPKITLVKVYTDPKGYSKFKARIEKLSRNDEINGQHAYRACQLMFNDFQQALGIEQSYIQKDNLKVNDNKDLILSTMHHLLVDNLKSQYDIRDSALKDALRFINELKTKNPNVELDMGVNNYLWRRGEGDTIQLVIADPFKNK